MENGIVMDVRDTVGLLSRSFELRGGDMAKYDRISG